MAETTRAGQGRAALAVQQAHNERSGRAGRARGVGTGGGMRAREGVDAARQRGSLTCRRAQPNRHPAPDALAYLRPTMGGCRRREGEVTQIPHKKRGFVWWPSLVFGIRNSEVAYQTRLVEKTPTHPRGYGECNYSARGYGKRVLLWEPIPYVGVGRPPPCGGVPSIIGRRHERGHTPLSAVCAPPKIPKPPTPRHPPHATPARYNSDHDHY